MTALGNAAKTAAQAVGTALKAVGAAVIAAGAAMVGLAESTREYRTEQAKLKTAFEAAGASAEDATNTYNGLYRVLGDSGQATEAANHIAQLTTNEKEMAEWTNICQGVYATFGDSLPIEGLTEAANETAKVGTVTGSLADALNWAGVSEDEFNEKLEACNSEAEREKLIRETLNGIYDEAAAGYEKNAASILSANEAQAKLTSGLAALGAAAEPVVTLMKSFAGDVLGEMAPHLEKVSQGLQDMVNGVEGGSAKLKEGISGALTGVIGKIEEILPTLISIGTEIILSLIQGITNALPTIITAVTDIIPQLIKGLLGCLPALIAGVGQLITGLAGALPEVMTAIVEVLPDVIQSIVDALIEALPALIEGLIQMIVILCENIDQIIQPLITALPDIIIAVVEALMNNLPTLIQGLITLILAVVDAIPQIVSALVDAMPEVIALIVEGLLSSLPALIVGFVQLVAGVVKAVPQIFGSLIKSILGVFTGIWEGVKNTFTKLYETVGGKVGDCLKKVKEKFEEIKTNIKNKIDEAKQAVGDKFESIKTTISSKVNGAKDTVLSVFDKIKSGIQDKINGARDKVKSAIDKIKGFFNFKWSLPKLKLPHFDIQGKFSLNPPSVPKFSISWNALGGIFDKPTLFNYGGSLQGIGEAGAEAVVPLEKNLGWLDKLAGMLNDRMGGGRPIVLQVDGKTFAEVSVSSINNLTKQTGSLPLVIA